MIDESKIKEAATKYIGSEPNDLLSVERRVSFQDGAEWAQQEFTKTLWHDASEEPKDYNEWVVIKYDNFDYVGTHQLRKYGNWENMVKNWPSFHWMYISDILPKEGGEQ